MNRDANNGDSGKNSREYFAAKRDMRDDDLLMQQVRAALVPMPSVDRRAIANILATVAQRKPTRIERLQMQWEDLLANFNISTSSLVRGAALASVAVAIGFVARGAINSNGISTPSTVATTHTGDNAPAVGSATQASPSITPSIAAPTLQHVDGATDRSELRVTTQFVLDAREAPAAAQLSVVGDFNDWDVRATPMTLDRGVWSVSLPMTQGRHVYAFVVNGKDWIADPRAPRTKDADFGRPSSVVIVQTP